MIAIFYLVLQILKLYSYVVIANVIVSWLIAFNILNTQNRFVYSILELSYRLTDPILNKIRRFLPNLGSFDISPIKITVRPGTLLYFDFNSTTSCLSFSLSSDAAFFPSIKIINF